MDIWKELVHFIAMKFGVANSSSVVYRTQASTKTLQPSPENLFLYKAEMPDGGKYEED